MLRARGNQLHAEAAEVARELKALKGEVAKALLGKSAFDAEPLGEMIAEKTERLGQAQLALHQARQDAQTRSPEIERKRQELMRYETWAAIFEDASDETKKMIIAGLVEKVSSGKGTRWPCGCG